MIDQSSMRFTFNVAAAAAAASLLVQAVDNDDNDFNFLRLLLLINVEKRVKLSLINKIVLKDVVNSRSSVDFAFLCRLGCYQIGS
jgi:hypothetical protein